jgi:wyosine [tRNA(Phe)-imidazoG37] synthetase (radical SAM superfamily)
VDRRRNVYGPVPSRRFGLSLGIDPLEPKRCCYDCVYCQQGRTTDLSSTRLDDRPVDEIVHDVERALERGPTPSVLTIAGSGEPLLYLSLEELIRRLRDVSGLPVVLLTNGALLDDMDARRAAAAADIVCPSLDAGDPDTFRKINRPHPDIRHEGMVEGLHALASESTGRYLLEVFIARGVNDSPEHVEKLVRIARSIAPDAIQLNTAVRPSPGRQGLALDADEMASLASRFGPTAEVIAAREPVHARRSSALPRDVLSVLERRPCTSSELAAALGIDAGDLDRTLKDLGRTGAVEQTVDGHWCIMGYGREKG